MFKLYFSFFLVALGFNLGNADMSTVCEGNTMNLTCDAGYLLNVDYANYGRLLPGCILCPKRFYDWNVLCFSRNATAIMRSRCNEKTSCSTPATDAVFGDSCANTYKYLLVTYSCFRYSRACENQNMVATCPSGTTIRVVNANYGRTAPGSEACSTSSDFNQNCRSANATAIAASRCNYQNSCTIKASNSIFGDPCPRTYKYLQMSYVCQ